MEAIFERAFMAFATPLLLWTLLRLRWLFGGGAALWLKLWMRAV